MQTVAECCVTEGRLLPFSFCVETPREVTGKCFCATLATQIYRRFPETRHSLRQAIIDNPLIFYQSLDTQLRELFIGPLRGLAPSVTNIMVIIDGLDECRDPRTQREILSMIGSSLGISPSLPTRFLIASRPEPNTRRVFDHDNLRRITRKLIGTSAYISRGGLQKYVTTTKACRPLPNHGHLVGLLICWWKDHLTSSSMQQQCSSL